MDGLVLVLEMTSFRTVKMLLAPPYSKCPLSLSPLPFSFSILPSVTFLSFGQCLSLPYLSGVLATVFCRI